MQIWELNELAGPVIQALYDAHVRFLMVGGWAVKFHGCEDREVKDLDLLVKLDAENWTQLKRVLEGFGVNIPYFEEISQRSNPIRVRDFTPLDFLTAIEGISFDEAWPESLETNFANGLPVRVISKAHLILNKRATGRPVDAEDIKLLIRTPSIQL